MKRYLYLIFFTGLLMFCGSRQTLTKDELNAYVLDEDNGLKKTIQSKDITLEMIYRPKDMVIAHEAGMEDRAKWEETEKELDSLDYFIFRLSRQGQEIENNYAGSEATYTQVINYLSGGIAEDIVLQYNGKMIPPEAVLFAPSYGSARASSILLVFKSYLNKQDGSETVSIAFDDKYFGTGQNDFTFDIGKIVDAPGLKK